MWIYDVQVNDIENDNVSVASNMALMKIKNYTDNRSITTDKKVIPYSSSKMMMTTTSNGNYKSLTMRLLINADNTVLKLKMSINVNNEN